MSNTSLEKSKIRILLLEGVHQSAIDTLNAAGYTNIEFLTHSLAEDELVEKIADAHFVGIRSRTQLTEKVFDAAQKLVAVGCFCIGTNQVDLQAATRRGIAVFNAPFSNTRSVAELVLAQAILLLRGVPEKNAKAHRGEWLKSAKDSYEIRGKKLGIIGYGNIGTQFSVLAEGLGMDVYFYDVVSKLSIHPGGHPAGAAQHLRCDQPARSRNAVHQVHVQGRAVCPDEAGQHPDERFQGYRGRH